MPIDGAWRNPAIEDAIERSPIQAGTKPKREPRKRAYGPATRPSVKCIQFKAKFIIQAALVAKSYILNPPFQRNYLLI
jgi:hypothetical protein